MSLRLDTREFRATMKQYLEHSSKTLPEIINTKAFFIARGATRETMKADAAKVEAQLGVVGREVRQLKRGKNKGKFRRGDIIVGSNRAQGRTLAELILRKRDRDRGEATGEAEMADRVHRFIKARLASIAYIKAGWIPAIKVFEKLRLRGGLGQKQDRSAKLKTTFQIGGASPAKQGFRPEASIWNAATTRHGKDQSEKALSKHATEGLQKAFDAEVRSMKTFIESQMQAMTDKVTKSFLR